MKPLMVVLLLLFTACGFSAELPNGPQPQTSNDYGPGLSFNNQLYALQGASVGFAAGLITHRPWLGAASGVGSCMLWRAVHDLSHKNDPMFARNRIAFCAAGAGAAYVTMKLIRTHR